MQQSVKAFIILMMILMKITIRRNVQMHMKILLNNNFIKYTFSHG
jgi:hypothetical protein